MKTKLHSFFLALALLAGVHQAAAQGTAFTYQGQLQNNGSPASGTYDLTFAVFTDSNGVNQIGGTLTNTATGITNGLFTVVLDFGPGIFTGPPLWLQLHRAGSAPAVDAHAVCDLFGKRRLGGVGQCGILGHGRRFCDHGWDGQWRGGWLRHRRGDSGQLGGQEPQ